MIIRNGQKVVKIKEKNVQHKKKNNTTIRHTKLSILVLGGVVILSHVYGVVMIILLTQDSWEWCGGILVLYS